MLWIIPLRSPKPGKSMKVMFLFFPPFSLKGRVVTEMACSPTWLISSFSLMGRNSRVNLVPVFKIFTLWPARMLAEVLLPSLVLPNNMTTSSSAPGVGIYFSIWDRIFIRVWIVGFSPIGFSSYSSLLWLGIFFFYIYKLYFIFIF